MKFNLNVQLKGDEEARKRIRLMSESFQGAPRRLASSAAKIIREQLKLAAPRGHEARHIPNLKESIGFLLAGSGSRWTSRFYGNYYAKWVIDGHGEIWAGIYTGRSTKRFLKFRNRSGRTIFTRHVRATLGDDFRKPAMRRARPELEALMAEEGIRTLRGVL